MFSYNNIKIATIVTSQLKNKLHFLFFNFEYNMILSMYMFDHL